MMVNFVVKQNPNKPALMASAPHYEAGEARPSLFPFLFFLSIRAGDESRGLLIAARVMTSQAQHRR